MSITTINPSSNTVPQMAAKINEIINIGLANVSISTVTTFNIRNSVTLGSQTIANTATIWTSANDGSGSTLDADLLDSYEAAAFARLAGTPIFSTTVTVPTINARNSVVLGNQTIANTATIWTSANDGASSGLDADTLDTYEAAAFARLAGTPTFSTPITISIGNSTTSNDNFVLTPTDYGTSKPKFVVKKATTAGTWEVLLYDGTNNNGTILFTSQYLQHNGSTIWTAGNDGASSGLDADLLDGQHGSYYAPIDSPTITTTMALSGTAPILRIIDTDSGTNAKNWRFFANNDVLYLQTVNDALSSTSNILSVTRSGQTPSTVTISPAVSLGSTLGVTGAATFSSSIYASTWAAAAIGTLTDGATITPDFSTYNNFTVTLGGNRTMASPTNVTAGQSGIIYVVQDGSGGRTLSWGSNWKFPQGTAPTLSTAINAVDAIVYTARTTTSITAQAILNVG